MKIRRIVTVTTGVALGALTGLAATNGLVAASSGAPPDTNGRQEVERVLGRTVTVVGRDGTLIRDCNGVPIRVDIRNPEADLVRLGSLQRSQLSDRTQPAGRLNAEGVEVARPEQWVATQPRC